MERVSRVASLNAGSPIPMRRTEDRDDRSYRAEEEHADGEDHDLTRRLTRRRSVRRAAREARATGHFRHALFLPVESAHRDGRSN
jgi:hypothetical protein